MFYESEFYKIIIVKLNNINKQNKIYFLYIIHGKKHLICLKFLDFLKAKYLT